jgi:hypothetical protein
MSKLKTDKLQAPVATNEIMLDGTSSCDNEHPWIKIEFGSPPRT